MPKIDAFVMNDEMRRTAVQVFNMHLASFQARRGPQRRQRGNRAARGADGASGLFLCTLAGDIEPGTTTLRGAGSGTVYSMAQGASNTSIGSRQIFNPYLIEVPSTGGGKTIIYTCEKTYEHSDEEVEDDDQFTIVGIDPLHLLASLTGFAANKILYTDGTEADNIQWGGACESFVVDVECVGGEIQLTEETFLAIACTP